MSKFTEAPWVADKHCDGVYSEIADRYVASTAFGYDDVDEDERKGNARLIAAAPELYEMLDKLVGAIDSVDTVNGLFPFGIVKIRSELVKDAKALLERIDGEEEQ